MARLSLFLPPFAGDYSGAASTLFGLDCLVILVDAGCCTRNYVEYDEPRWARRRKTAFSAQLRTLEAVMGDDRRIVDQVVDAARELGSSCVAILGTPVPAITGMDLPGIAQAVERACGVPAVGIETCGFETYEQGVARAAETLVRRFAASPADADACAAGRPRVGVWGLSPHDFLGTADMQAVLGWFDDAGLEVVCAPGGPWSHAALQAVGGVDANLAVAWSGLAPAHTLARRFGTPCLVGRPWCTADARRMADAVRAGLPRAGEAVCLADGVAPDACAPEPDAPPVVLVGEQVAMACLRPHLEAALAQAGRPAPVTCATFFAADPSLARPGDLRLPDEAALLAWARNHPGFAWVGDPLLARLPGFAEAPHAELPHEAVSSTLYADRAAALAGEGALALLAPAVASLAGR